MARSAAPQAMTKLMKRFSIVLLMGLTAVLNVRAAQESEFSVVELSKNGRMAYEKLVNVGMFAVGPVGFGGQTTDGELALHVLLTERNATRALKSLVKVASLEGRLYGLFGLRLNDIDAQRRKRLWDVQVLEKFSSPNV